jgi:hypothetical protein
VVVAEVVARGIVHQEGTKDLAAMDDSSLES